MLMKTLAHLSGLLIIGITASHAEPAGPDGAIILDKTHYEYCQDNSNRIVSTAKPPYYVALRCINFHSTDPLLATKCSSYMKYSYCTAQECEKEVYRNSNPTQLGGSATMQNVCATADGYGGFDIIRPTVQETAAVPPPAANANSAQCDPAFVTMNAILVHATIACNKDYMDTKIGIDTMVLAHQCDAVLGKQKIHSIIRTAMQEFDNEVKDGGKKEACARVDNAFSEIGEAVKN